MTIAEQVALALRQTEGTQRVVSHDDASGSATYRLTPNRVSFALGWIVANGVVAAYYRTRGIDVLPSYDPRRGWDRFLLTRRVSCWRCSDDRVDRLGSILLEGKDAPLLVCGERGTRLPLRDMMSRDPEAGMQRVLEYLSAPTLPDGDHADCWHRVAEFYPALYDAVMELVLQSSGLVAARELFVDDQEVDGTYHPLYLHGFVTSPKPVYDWFAVETSEHVAYIRINGRCALYQTDAGSWSTVKRQLVDEDREGVTQRIRAWLRISGKPDPLGAD